MNKLILISGVAGVAGALFFLIKKKESPAVIPEQKQGSISDGSAAIVSTGSGFFDDMVMNVNKAFEPRGIRNNNPGNMVITSIPWKGKVPVAQNTDKHFEQFTSPLWGIRAMYMDVKNDIEKDGLNTIRKLIHEYAPSHENNTAAYIDFVSKSLGIGADTKLTVTNYFGLIKAIIQIENGKQPYSDALILEAISTK